MNAAEQNRPAPVAIIGIGCLFPRAADGAGYWANILNKVDAVTEVPPSHWKPEDYFDPNAKAPDRTYARRGAFLSPVDFPPLDFGISPNTLEATDATQLLGLVVARQALEDAGYGSERTFDRSRVSVILGITGTLELVIPLGARLGHPHWRKALKEAGVPDAVAEDVVQRIADSYVGWQEESFPGLLGNVVAGRIANRLDLGGTNCVVDAACASSLSALHLAIMELASGRSDMVLTGGMDTFNDIFMYMCFSKTPALSPTGDARPFDAAGDGTILGEGLGCLVLKRLSDAERDGDRIYAVVRSVGSSSDGKGQAIYAPRSTGQARALRQAYRLADVTPETIELIEAHGTGTRAGDAAEVAGLKEVYGSAERQGSWCAVGSVKSQIGHTKAAAGAAGLIKAALALHHKVLPPTIKVKQPIEALAPGAGPFYVNTEKRPWLPSDRHPRRAAVSSFGFGGSNFHCVLEEYRSEKPEIDWDGNVQLVAFSAPTREQLRTAIAAWPASLPWDEFRGEAARTRAAFRAAESCRLLLVVEKDKTDLARLLAGVRTMLERDSASWTTPDGACFGSGPSAGKLGMVFPGQGSQYVGMLRDLACQFPQVQQALAEANTVLADLQTSEVCQTSEVFRLTDFIYPQPVFRDEDRVRLEEALRATDIAQPALGAVSLGALTVLRHFGVIPEAVAGHSYGELVALFAAGRIDAATLHSLSRIRGKLMAEGAGDRGAMLAVQAGMDELNQVLREEKLQLVIANRNAPRQAVLSGAKAEIERAVDALGRRKLGCKKLPVAAAFHSPLVAEAQHEFLAALETVSFAPAELPVFSNTTAWAYPQDPQQARALLAGQLAEPVAFVEEIENLYRSGVRTYLEVGPGNKLAGLIAAILEGRPHAVCSVDASSGQRSGSFDLARALAQLAALGHVADLARWDEGAARTIPPKKPAMTIPICGANYVKPRTPRPPLISASKNGEKTVSMEKHAPGAKPQAESSTPGEREDSTFHQVIQTSLAVSRSPVESSGPLAQALQITQENLTSLQKLGEQTARLHGQFLDNQSRSLQAFQVLLQQQQTLLQASLGMTPVSVAVTPPPMIASPAPQPILPAAAPNPEPAARSRPADVAATATRAEAPAQVQPIAAAPPPPEPAPVAMNGHTSTVLLEVVSEKTGYPTEMLELDMELDADLGIDSIKRVEIFSSLQEKLPHTPVIKPEHLGTLRTLRNVVDFLGGTNGDPTAAKHQHAERPMPEAGPAGKDSPELATVLLGVVADKTGYPAEMLELDMELDADLGIDSIKRVEIFSSLQEKLPHTPVIKPEHLGSLRTLRHVIDFLGGAESANRLNGAPVPSAQPHPPTSPPIAPAQGSLQRYVLGTVELDASSTRETITLAEGGEIWVTEDGSGLAASVTARLGLLGYRARLVSLSDWQRLQPPASLAGLLILAGPRNADDRLLHQSFQLVQLAGTGLRQAGNERGAVLLTLSRLDGAFGLLNLNRDANPLSGGLAGLAKTAGHEWPAVHCKALDLAYDFADTDEAALWIVEEMLLSSPVEVGLSNRGRCTVSLSQVLDQATEKPKLSKGDVVIVSGGARGVTAAAAIALARQCSPTLVLLGRSPAPAPEPDWLSVLSEENEIKRALHAHANGHSSPRELGEQYRQVSANREIQRTLKQIQAAGSKIIYRTVDVRSDQAVRQLLAEVRQTVGPIRGLVHGAGVLADRRIEDKTLEQFESVYATKVLGLRHLLAATEPDDLKVLALFSSSTGRFGRAGQVDYAVANEVLNKLAQQQARCRPGCRVVSINWGPWDGGMVNPALKHVFEKEGVGVIPLEAAAEFFVAELDRPADEAVELVVLGPGSTSPAAPEPPLRVPGAPLKLAFERELSVQTCPVLRSHVIANRAVLPMALTMEWLAHAALHGNPGLVFQGIDDLRILKGIRLTAEQQYPVRVLAGKLEKQGNHYLVRVELHGTDTDGRDVLHATAAVVLGNRLPPADASVPDVPLRAYGRSPAEVYDGFLFHGPDLNGIQEIEGCSEHGMAARAAAAPSPASWLQRPLRSSWLTDPLMIDCALQLMCLWSREIHGAFSLPTSLRCYRQYRRSFPREGVRIVAAVKQHNSQRLLVDFWLLDQQGEPVARIENCECVIDVALNQAFRRNRLTHEPVPTC